MSEAVGKVKSASGWTFILTTALNSAEGVPPREGPPADMTKTLKKEEIILDARLVDALECATFLAELENGHQIVAFSVPKKTLPELGLRLGDSVRVVLSPYDMLKGIILNDTPDHLQEQPT